MTGKIIRVDKDGKFPLFGLDFLGILDRGTNVLEVKPITICNLHCRYCFVSAGDYKRNFLAERHILLEWIQRAISIKNAHDIEIHIAPYGEFILYPEIYQLIEDLRKIPQIKTISAQSNGLLLTFEKIKKLEKAGLDRLNISLNSLDSELNSYLCDFHKYNVEHLLKIFRFILEQTSMELLIAPVWFMGKNDQGILDILELVKKWEKEGFSWPKLRLGIQNYLTYKTGRKLGHVKSREFRYFYSRLRQFEKQYQLKLKLGPADFNIFKTTPIIPPVKINQKVRAKIVMQGRWNNEYIGQVNDFWAIKIISREHLYPDQHVKVKVIRSNLTGNLLTGVFSP